MSQEQSAYLDIMFAMINKYFTALGNRDFSLQKGSSNRGHTPIYFLKVKFKEKSVAEADLDKVFSESDRRALCLAVFLSSLEALPPKELAKTVLLLDDPVTSFDECRVGQTHKTLMELSNRCEQLILLSHFKEGIANFLQTHASSTNHQIKLIKIDKNADTSTFEAGDINAFVRSAHSTNRDSILDFIDRVREKPSCSLRVFLEAELGYRFGKQIRRHSITNGTLKELIEALHDKGVICNTNKEKLHRWRKELNTEHHVCMSDDIENQRTTAHQFMQYLYQELAPAA